MDPAFRVPLTASQTKGNGRSAAQTPRGATNLNLGSSRRSEEHQARVAQQRETGAGAGDGARCSIADHADEQPGCGDCRDDYPEPPSEGSSDHRGKWKEVRPDNGAAATTLTRRERTLATQSDSSNEM